MRRRANCHVCKWPITLANVWIMTETTLIWDCGCGTKTHRGVSKEVREAICGPLQVRLPYSAAPNPHMLLDETCEQAIAWWGLVLHTVCCADDFCARAAHEVAGGSHERVTPADGSA